MSRVFACRKSTNSSDSEKKDGDDMDVDHIAMAAYLNEVMAWQVSRRLDLRAYPKFRCHGNKGRPHNILDGSIESAIPKNPLVGPNISGLSGIQADL